MQIMQNPQPGFLGTHQFFNQCRGKTELSWKNQLSAFFSMFIMVSWLMFLYYHVLGLERIHQVTNTIRAANTLTGWRIRICIHEYSCIHSCILLTECASEEEEVKNVYSANTWGLHYTFKTETPIKTCNVSLAWEPPLKRYNDITTPIIESLKSK